MADEGQVTFAAHSFSSTGITVEGLFRGMRKMQWTYPGYTQQYDRFCEFGPEDLDSIPEGYSQCWAEYFGFIKEKPRIDLLIAGRNVYDRMSKHFERVILCGHLPCDDVYAVNRAMMEPTYPYRMKVDL